MVTPQPNDIRIIQQKKYEPFWLYVDEPDIIEIRQGTNTIQVERSNIKRLRALLDLFQVIDFHQHDVDENKRLTELHDAILKAFDNDDLLMVKKLILTGVE